MLPLNRIIIHLTHLQMIDHQVLDMAHLLLPTTTHPLPPLRTRTRDMGIYQLDLLPRIIMHHPRRHLTFPQAMDMLLLLLTLHQVVVGIIPIQILLRATEVLRPRIPLLAMEHHPQIPLITTINPHLLHIILTLHTTIHPTTPTTPLLPLQEDTPNPHLQDTHSLLLLLMIQLLRDRGIDLMYLLLLIHDDHLLLRRDKANIGHLKGRVVKLGICWLGLYVPLSFAVIRWLMDRTKIDKDRTRRRRN
jgi:hypothetical protein